MKVAVLTISALLFSGAAYATPTSTNCEIGLVSKSWKDTPFAFVKNANGTTLIPCDEAKVWVVTLNERHNHGANPVTAVLIKK